MSSTQPSEVSSETMAFMQISDALRSQGYVVMQNVFSTAQLQSLLIDIKQSDHETFHQAGIGRDQSHQLNQFVRRDRIRWLDMQHEPVRFYLQWAERLRLHINRQLLLGLFDYECHYAHYPIGAFYKKHVDAFKGRSNRCLTTILYLNPAWQPTDGGELLLYAEDDSRVLQTILPAFGTMVIFLSEDFPHEVLPTRCSRYSLTGWYRVNNTTTLNLDPPA